MRVSLLSIAAIECRISEVVVAALNPTAAVPPPELLPSCDERSAHSCTVKFDVFIVHKAWFILKYIQYLISSTLTGLNIGRVYVCL